VIVWKPYALAWRAISASWPRHFLQGWASLPRASPWYGYTNVDQTLVRSRARQDALGAYSFAVTFPTSRSRSRALSSAASCPASFRVQNNRAELAPLLSAADRFLASSSFHAPSDLR